MRKDKKIMAEQTQERVKPIIITDKETGEPKYTLEFNRKTIKLAERNGFKLDDVMAYPMTKPVELFYYALQMHHRGMTMDRAEELFDTVGGLAQEGLLKRLFELYNEPFRALQGDDGDDGKNAGKYEIKL